MKKLYFIIIATLSLTLCSCGDMNDVSRKYLDRGETIYTGAVDSLRSYGGYNRIQLNWEMSADPRIKELVILWNNKKDSLILPVTRTSEDKIGIYQDSIMINNMLEGAETFQFYTRDNNGHTSVIKELTGEIYGDMYKESMSLKEPRTLLSQSVSGNNLVLTFQELTSTTTIHYTIITYYTAKDDGTIEEKSVVLNNDSREAVLENPLSGSTITYQSYYLPEASALDAYPGKAGTTIAPIINAAITADSDMGTSMGPSNLLDGNPSTVWFSSMFASYPHWVKIDFKHEQTYTQLILWTGTSSPMAKTAYIEVSEDGNTWTQVNVDGSTLNANGHYQFAITTTAKKTKMTYTFAKVQGRYFRITFTESVFPSMSWAVFGDISIVA